MRSVALLGALALGATCAAGCSGSKPEPPAAPAAPQVQEVPQLANGDGSLAPVTFCLAPAGSGLRDFVSFDGHGRRIHAIVDVSSLPERSPYRCP